MPSTLKRTTRIGVIDLQPMYRAGIARILAGCASVEFVGDGGSPSSARTLARLHGPDILILDVSLDSEFTLIAELLRCHPDMAIVVVGGSADVEGIAHAMRAGVRGCLPRCVDGPGLIEAIDRVVEGELYVAPAMGWQLLARLTSGRIEPSKGPPVVNFTSREEEIIDLVALGATNKEVARKLAVSIKTVKHHLTNVMQKLRVRNRVEAVVAYRARTNGTTSAPRAAAAAHSMSDRA